MKKITLCIIVSVVYTLGYWIGREWWHPKPITEIIHTTTIPPSDELKRQIQFLWYGKGARDALNCWMLLDLELSLDNKRMSNGELALIVGDRMKITPDPDWQHAKRSQP